MKQRWDFSMVEVYISKDNKLNIKINGSSHLKISCNNLLGYQSWLDYSDEKSPYYIEYYFTNKDYIYCSYDNVDRWKSILEGLDKIL